MKTFDSSRFFYQNSDKGIVRTPEDLAQQMISKIPEYIFESSTTNFLDPACGRGTFLVQITKKLKSYGHSWENITSRIFGIDIDPFSGIKQAQYILGSKNIIVQDFLEMNLPTSWPKEFDVIVSNPPYGTRTTSLHLKFLEKSLEIYKEKIVFVHPSTPFIDKKGNNKTYNEINESIQNRLESLTFFNGNGIFGITLKVPCSITVIGNPKVNSNFTVDYLYYKDRKEILSEISDVSLFGKSGILKSISKKIKLHSQKNLHTEGNVLGTRDIDNRILKNPNSFIVQFSHIQGNTETENTNLDSGLFKKNFFILVNIKEYRVEHAVVPRYNIWFEFKTKEEAENFLNFCKTDFARFCLSISKRNQHLSNGELKSVPWMDFTQVWTDEKLFKHFNINQEEQEFIKEIIPPYYD
jgi:type I restriction-modification system DNA methylase subunit